MGRVRFGVVRNMTDLNQDERVGVVALLLVVTVALWLLWGRAHEGKWRRTFWLRLSGALLFEWLALVHIDQIQFWAAAFFKSLFFYALSLLGSFFIHWGPGIVVGLILPPLLGVGGRALFHRLSNAILIGAFSAAFSWYFLAYAQTLPSVR